MKLIGVDERGWVPATSKWSTEITRTCAYTFFCAMELHKAIEESVAVLGLESLKEHQMEAVTAFMSGSDVFVALPTGYGKSIIYAILPLLFDKVKGTKLLLNTRLVIHAVNQTIHFQVLMVVLSCV